MKLKQLVALLQRVPEFPEPSYELEQYKTSAELAAEVVFSVERAFGDIGGRLVADLGCGTGVLSVACAALGAAHVVAVDVDAAALAAARAAADELGLLDAIEFVRADVIEMAAAPRARARRRARAGPDADEGGGAEGGGAADDGADGDGDGDGDDALAAAPARSPVFRSVAAAAPRSRSAAGPASELAPASAPAPEPAPSPAARARRPADGPFDTVVMNPPFGTRRAGADVAFLRAALALAGPRGRVYSLHKSSTRAHLARVAARLGVGCALVAELSFPIPATYAFHRDEARDVAVDLLRFVKGGAGAGAAGAEARAASLGAMGAAASLETSERARGGGGGAGGGRGGGRGGGGRGAGSSRRGKR